MKASSQNSEFVQLIHMLSKNSKYVRAIQKANEVFNLKTFNVKILTSENVIQFYNTYQNRIQDQESVILDKPWLQNQRRIFLWLIFGYCFIKGIQIDQLQNEDWDIFVKIFPKRDPIIFRYQINLLQKKKQKNCRKEKWVDFQRKTLVRAIQCFEQDFKWNSIAKKFYQLTGEQYFRTPKQCREQWKNHLNTELRHGNWTPEEDQILMQMVQKKGKKWALISKGFKTKRTEHMIKNRYNTLIKRSERKYSDISEYQLDKNSSFHRTQMKIQNSSGLEQSESRPKKRYQEQKGRKVNFECQGSEISRMQNEEMKDKHQKQQYRYQRKEYEQIVDFFQQKALKAVQQLAKLRTNDIISFQNEKLQQKQAPQMKLIEEDFTFGFQNPRTVIDNLLQINSELLI